MAVVVLLLVVLLLSFAAEQRHTGQVNFALRLELDKRLDTLLISITKALKYIQPIG